MSEEKLYICPFLSNAPYFVACNNGKIILMTTKVVCEIPCASWEDDHCVRLNRSKCSCGIDSKEV